MMFLVPMGMFFYVLFCGYPSLTVSMLILALPAIMLLKEGIKCLRR